MPPRPTTLLRLRPFVPLIGALLLVDALQASAASVTAGAAPQPFTVEDLVRLKRISDPQASPDGRYVAFTLRETDIEANKGRTDLWLVDLAAKRAQPRRLTQNPADDSSPRWAPDSRTLYFLSTRSGSSQVWRLSLDGGEATRVTDYPLDIDTFAVAPAGSRIAVTMGVFIDCPDLPCTKRRLGERDKSQATGRSFDRLFVRHWDTWSDGTRSHLFTALIGADGTAGDPVDLAKTQDADVPSKPDGGSEEYAFSPDGERLVWSARVADRGEPWSTNFDLFEAPVDGSAAPKNLTADNPAWDTRPVFLKNGDLAYLAMDRAGFEADRFHIVLRDARSGRTRARPPDWDRSVSHLAALPDGTRLIASADDLGQHALFSIELASGQPTRLWNQGQITDFTIARDSVVIALASLAAPAELQAIPAKGGTLRRLTDVNGELLRARAMSAFEQFSFRGANDETVYGYVMKPSGYASGRKFPMAFVVHGGPQTGFANLWTYRWNAQVFAGAGYGVVFIDFHGSPGYGQKFTDSISGDWGGKPLLDLQKGLEAALAKYPWLDGERACSLGASYGGFMQNWIEGNWPDRFRCLVNHSGLFDQRMMYYSTEELWFPEWEFGAPYFEKPENYERFNPAGFVTRWRTPMLVIHGARDYRIPYTQGLASFTALQRRGIESKFLYFPDEGHWILKPANSVLWYHTVLDWLDRHLKE
jgi:dipeptidyl aminopeptidase/acylaminoacyl peptidase